MTTETNTKVRIRQKAEELFMKYGIRSVSMDDIANALGMSKKTIYQYFVDKDELVTAVVEADVQDMQGDCIKILEGSKDAIHEIFLTIDRLLEQFRNMNPMLIYDLEKFHIRGYQKFMDHKNKFLLQVIRKNLERGLAEGLYRDDLNADLVARFRLESMMIPFNIDLFPPTKFSMADVSKEIMELYVHGLVSQKGYKLIVKYKEERLKQANHDTLSGKTK
ncbi:TetR/AcrR family transcriptional regulator [Paraflavitalea sp. CAU 1676]|uniref:TetR/AcrR family transcriptional regulator n=1 Tax=Paraflavitalea sp. CAU 1676 TaxID=3032598 RepID=UPI0023DAF7E7|nr:TetR/AcrR family transcriptional regulator [Paraflavitalea sp. CAU 1676]MDF2190738.1 TetR/AcrR family transcriptional regulator [Paraflavitalea sp. CAU 1676]